MKFFANILFFIIFSCQSDKNTTNFVADVKSNQEFPKQFKSNTHPILKEDASKRLFDCIEDGPITPTGFWVKHKEFNYFSETKQQFMDYGLIEMNKWPVLVSYFKPNEIPPENQHVILAFRGDTSGFHKSISTQPFLSYVKNKPQDRMLFFLDEYMYINEKEQDIEKSRIQALCHTKTYWMGYINREWPALQKGGSWQLVDNFFTKNQKFILFTYSNGSVPRSEFLHRTFLNSYTPDFSIGFNSPSEFLEEYIKNTKLTNSRSLNIEGIMDIEGNFNREKPMWDTLAFLNQYVDTDKSKFFYSNARVDKPDAYPGQVM